MSRYMKPEQKKKIIEQCKVRKDSYLVGQKRKIQDRFAAATDAVLKMFQTNRAKGRRCGPRWLRATMRREIRKHYDTPYSRAFKCSEKFLRDWRRRHKISIRRRTNAKKKDPKQLEAPLISMHRKFKQRVCTERKGKATFHDTEGAWHIAHRFSIDQVCHGRWHVCDMCVRVGAYEPIQWWYDHL